MKMYLNIKLQTIESVVYSIFQPQNYLANILKKNIGVSFVTSVQLKHCSFSSNKDGTLRLQEINFVIWETVFFINPKLNEASHWKSSLLRFLLQSNLFLPSPFIDIHKALNIFYTSGFIGTLKQFCSLILCGHINQIQLISLESLFFLNMPCSYQQQS